MMDSEQSKRRLPKDAKDWAELEALAAKGPGAVYGWIFGPGESLVQETQPGKLAGLKGN